MIKYKGVNHSKGGNIMEDSIATPKHTRRILDRYGLKLHKGLGQNFLIDQNIIEKIIDSADIKGDELIVEIGPGIGSLTQAILDRLTSGILVAIEKDSRFIEVLSDVFSGDNRLKLVNKDVLDIDWGNIIKRWNINNSNVKLLANLPYYITTPIIMGILESNTNFSSLTFMVQKEVADRMVASPGGKDYGSLSIAVQFYAKINIVSLVPPTVFIPRPNVYSSIVSLIPYKKSPVKVKNKDFFFKVVKAIFQQRRKNIKNALRIAPDLTLNKEVIIPALEKAGIDQKIRGEKLSINEIAFLSNIIWDYIK